MTPETRRIVGWLRAAGRPARGPLVLAVTAGWLAGAATLAVARFLSETLDAVVMAGALPQSLHRGAVLFLFAWSARALFAWAKESAAFEAGARVRETVRSRMLDRIAARGPAYTRDQFAGGLATVLMEQVESLHDYYALFRPQLALCVLVPLTIAAAVFSVSWLAAVLLLVAGPMIPFFSVLVGMGAESISQRHFAALARLGAHFFDVLQGIATLKLFGRSRDAATGIAASSADYRRRTMAVLRVAFISSAVLEFIAALSIALVAVYLGMTYLGYFSIGTWGRRLGLSDGLFILLLAPEFFMPLRELGAHYHARARALAAGQALRQVLEEEQESLMPGRERPDFSQGIGLDCDGLCYGYEDGRGPALEGLHLTVSPGAFAAVVGASGAGKSTLAGLLLGFIRPGTGIVYVNGTPLSEIDPRHWRQQVGWIGQNPVVFSGTIATNIRMARPDAPEEAVAEAARAAGVLDFSRELPGGLDTPLGEGGVGLSRGQAQRVALARVFLKNPPFLILDEPTAGLDAHTEARVLEALYQMRSGRTVLMITHRLADIEQADVIHVMAGGRVVESGDYESLTAAGGPFHRLVHPFSEIGGRHG